jgi:hypothetical protein
MQRVPGFTSYGLASKRFTMSLLQFGAGPAGGKNQAKINLCGVRFETS